MIRRPLTATVALLATAVLAGCGSGQNAETYKPRTAADATNTSVGTLALRNLAIQAPSTGGELPAGGEAILTGSFVNEGDLPDQLVSATTEVAATVALREGAAVVTSIDVPALGVSSSTASLVLRGLTRPLAVGSYVKVTLAFAQNGRKDVLVPVQSDPNRPREAAPTESGGTP